MHLFFIVFSCHLFIFIFSLTRLFKKEKTEETLLQKTRNSSAYISINYYAPVSYNQTLQNPVQKLEKLLPEK